MLTFGNPVVRLKDKLAYEITRLESYLTDIAPILATDRIGCYTENFDFSEGFVFDPVPGIFLDKFTKVTKQDKSTSIRLIPPGKYICVYGTGKFGETNEYIKSACRYIHDKGYICGGLLYNGTLSTSH